jgi:multidrug resistance efflux pump
MIQINNGLGKRYYNALIKKYEAEMAESEANLDLYMNNLVAIGEHSDLLEEHVKWVEKYTNAKDNLETLNQLFQVKI